MRSNRIVYSALVLILMGCASGRVSSPKYSSANDYYEDLTTLRPQFESTKNPGNEITYDSVSDIAPTEHIANELTAKIDSIAIYTKENLRHIDGYAIQVYTGNNKNLARNILRELNLLYGEYQPKISFEPPVYKVKLGKFSQRIEVQRLFAEIRQEYPKSIIIPEKIQINTP